MKKKAGATKGKHQRTRPGLRDLGGKDATVVTGGLLPAVKSGSDGTSATGQVFVKIQHSYREYPG